jgi:hypothetical protein
MKNAIVLAVTLSLSSTASLAKKQTAYGINLLNGDPTFSLTNYANDTFGTSTSVGKNQWGSIGGFSMHYTKDDFSYGLGIMISGSNNLPNLGGLSYSSTYHHASNWNATVGLFTPVVNSITVKSSLYFGAGYTF